MSNPFNNGSNGYGTAESCAMRRARLEALLAEPVSVANLTAIAEEMAGGMRPRSAEPESSQTFYQSGAIGLLIARCEAHGLDPEPYLAIIDDVPSKKGV